MTPAVASKTLRALCARAPVIPVMDIHDATLARPLAEALVEGGLRVLEVTLRTDAAEAALREMAALPGVTVGAGTLLTPYDLRRAQDAGAAFGVSPGATDILLDAAETIGLPFLPGAVTPTEGMRLLARGYDMLKFFPAAASGGPAALRALAAPLPRLSFCATGGITAATAPDYLALDNVLSVGGSWTAPRDLVEARDWPAITALAREAAATG